MDGNLVEQTRFGEGINFSPAMGLVYNLTPNDVFSVGTSFNFKRFYVPEGDTDDLFIPDRKNGVLKLLQNMHLMKQ